MRSIEITIKVEKAREYLAKLKIYKEICSIRANQMSLRASDVKSYCQAFRDALKSDYDFSDIKEVKMDYNEYLDTKRKLEDYNKVKAALEKATDEEIINGIPQIISKIQIVSK